MKKKTNKIKRFLIKFEFLFLIKLKQAEVQMKTKKVQQVRSVLIYRQSECDQKDQSQLIEITNYQTGVDSTNEKMFYAGGSTKMVQKK